MGREFILGISMSLLVLGCGESVLAGDGDAELEVSDDGEDAFGDEAPASDIAYPLHYSFSYIEINAQIPTLPFFYTSIYAHFGHPTISVMEILYSDGSCFVVFYPHCDPDCDYLNHETCIEGNVCTSERGLWFVGTVEIRGTSIIDSIPLPYGEYGPFYHFDIDEILFNYKDLIEIEVQGNSSFEHFSETILYPELLSGIEIPGSMVEDPYMVRWNPSDGDMLIYKLVLTVDGVRAEKQLVCVSDDDGEMEIPREALDLVNNEGTKVPFLYRCNAKEREVGGERVYIEACNYGY